MGIASSAKMFGLFAFAALSGCSAFLFIVAQRRQLFYGQATIFTAILNTISIIVE